MIYETSFRQSPGHDIENKDYLKQSYLGRCFIVVAFLKSQPRVNSTLLIHFTYARDQLLGPLNIPRDG